MICGVWRSSEYDLWNFRENFRLRPIKVWECSEGSSRNVRDKFWETSERRMKNFQEKNAEIPKVVRDASRKVSGTIERILQNPFKKFWETSVGCSGDFQRTNKRAREENLQKFLGRP